MSGREPAGPKTSALIRALLDGQTGNRVTLGHGVAALGDRAFGCLLVVFAAPNLFPVMIPGLSTVLGAPLILLSAQMVLGYERPVLPRRLTTGSVDRSALANLFERLIPWLERIERRLRPRLQIATPRQAERLLGVICLVLALVLILPIPLGNFLPALAIVVIALGMIERDGVVALVGLGLAAASLAVVSVTLVSLYHLTDTVTDLLSGF